MEREYIVTFMKEVFDCYYAEIAPPLTKEEECWKQPIFWVKQP